MNKRLLFVLLTGLVLLVSAGVARAADPPVITVPTEDYGNVLMINDGRLNGFDVAAPVAVYYKYDTVRQVDGKDLRVLRGIELLAIQPKTNIGQLVMDVPITDIVNVIDTSKDAEGLLIAEENGYSLYYSKANWFWVTAPPDKEGKVYTFEWQNFSIQHD